MVSRQREVSAVFKFLGAQSFENLAGKLNTEMLYWIDSIIIMIYWLHLELRLHMNQFSSCPFKNLYTSHHISTSAPIYSRNSSLFDTAQDNYYQCTSVHLGR